MSPASLLAPIRGLVLDMDGVLWQGARALPGLNALFAIAEARGIELVLATNNSSRRPEDHAARLAGMGQRLPPERILTSSTVTAARLARDHAAGASVYVLGGEGLRQALLDAGLRLLDGPPGPPDPSPAADVVAVGIDFEISYPRLAAAALHLQRGARFVGTNGDPAYPAEAGLLPGAGAFIAALETATGRRAERMGKPEPPIFAAALERLALPASAVAMVGDRLDTDIAGANRAGMLSILVQSGVTPAGDLPPDAPRPDLILAGIDALAELLARLP